MSRTHHHGEWQKKKLYGDLWWWYRSAPKLWRHYHKHKPQRAAARESSHRVMTGELEALWPLDRKPHVYYW